MQVFAAGVGIPREEAHFVLNGMVDPFHQRRYVRPEDWYLCPDWLSWGQREGIDAIQYMNIGQMTVPPVHRMNSGLAMRLRSRI